MARTLIANKCITAFHVGLLQYLSLLWLCVLAFLGLNLGAKAAMVRSVRGAHTLPLVPLPHLDTHSCMHLLLCQACVVALRVDGVLSSRLAASELQHHGLKGLCCIL